MIPARYKAGRKAYAGKVRDALGNTRDTWADPVDFPVIWGSPGDNTGEPVIKNRDASVVEWTLCVPPGTELSGRDRVVWRGQEYGIEGEPRDWTLGPWRNPLAAVLVSLKLTEG